MRRASSYGSQRLVLTVIHHVRVTGTAGGVRIGETGKLVFTVIVYDNAQGKGLSPSHPRRFDARGLGPVHMRVALAAGTVLWFPGTARARSRGPSAETFTETALFVVCRPPGGMADRPCSVHSQPENHAASLSPAALVLTRPSFHITKRPLKAFWSGSEA